jgi:hypothetical protein
MYGSVSRTLRDRVMGNLALLLIVAICLAADRLPRRNGGPTEWAARGVARLVIGGIALSWHNGFSGNDAPSSRSRGSLHRGRGVCRRAARRRLRPVRRARAARAAVWLRRLRSRMATGRCSAAGGTARRSSPLARAARGVTPSTHPPTLERGPWTAWGSHVSVAASTPATANGPRLLHVGIRRVDRSANAAGRDRGDHTHDESTEGRPHDSR